MNIFKKTLNNNKISLSNLNKLSLDQVIIVEEQLDDFFNLQYTEIEKSLRVSSTIYPKESYIENDLECNALNNSYLDFYRIAQALEIKSNETFVDLGAGYCKAGLAIPLLNSEIKVTCLEFVKERIESAKNASLKLPHHSTQFIVQNLLEENLELPTAKYYFIYLPNGKLLASLLKRLKKISLSSHFKLIVIESHGELVNRLKIEKSWLDSPIVILQSSLQRHDNNIYVFETKKQHQELSQHEKEIHKIEDVIYSTKHSEIIFKDFDHGDTHQYSWSASSLGAQLNFLDVSFPSIELLYPPKIMPIDYIERVNKDIKSVDYINIFNRRNNDHDFKISMNQKEFNAGKLRKIILKKDIILEFSRIGRIPYSKIEIL